MITMGSILRRLFGFVVIDSLGLHRNAWSIDDTKVTATAAQLNNPAVVVPKSVTYDKFSGVAGNMLTGGDGTAPLRVKNTIYKSLIRYGTAPGVSIPMVGVKPTDHLISVFAMRQNEGAYDRTSEFVCGTDQFVKAAGSNDGARAIIFFWIDTTP